MLGTYIAFYIARSAKLCYVESNCLQDKNSNKNSILLRFLMEPNLLFSIIINLRLIRIACIDHFVPLIPASSRQGQENSKLRRRGKCFRFCDLFVRTFSVLPHLSTHSIYYKRALQSTARLFCIVPWRSSCQLG